MTHRGATGADARDGDGAGCVLIFFRWLTLANGMDVVSVMVGIPDAFFRRVRISAFLALALVDTLRFLQEVERDLDIVLPPKGQYAVGNVFFKPRDDATRGEHEATFEAIAESLNLRVLGWRDVPRDNSILGPAALSREPLVRQPFVVLATSYGYGNKPEEGKSFDEKYFARQLYVLRKHTMHTITLANWFYVCSLSPTNIVYKGQLSPPQVCLSRICLFIVSDADGVIVILRSTTITTISTTPFLLRTFVWFTRVSRRTLSPAGTVRSPCVGSLTMVRCLRSSCFRTSNLTSSRR
jgi:glutamate synthase (NADPH/NADH)